MRILVTGHSGFVGTHLMQLLEAAKLNEQTLLGISTSNGFDIRDYESIRQVIATWRPDQIHHLAAQAYVPESSTDSLRAVQVNVQGTLNLMQAIRAVGSRAKVHIAGTSEEYGYDQGPDVNRIGEMTPCRPTNVYGATKLSASSIALAYGQTYGIPVVVTRAFNHTGPGQPDCYAVPAFVRRVVEYQQGLTKEIRHGNLNAERDYTDVRDVVRAYRAAIELEPGIYNIGSGRVRSLAGVLDLLLDLVEQPEAERMADPGLYRPAMALGGPMPYCDASKFIAATGWRPAYLFEETLADMLDYWRQEI